MSEEDSMNARAAARRRSPEEDEVEAVAQANTYRSIGASVPSAPAASRAAPDVLIGTAMSATTAITVYVV